MYLRLLVLLPFITITAWADCGCQLNRNDGCGSPDAKQLSHKYSKQANDNNPAAFSTENMVLVKGATFEMGTNEPHFPTDFEGPVKNVTLKSFYLDKYEVSNGDFAKFVKETGYRTEAEEFGDSFIFEMLVPETEREDYKDFRAVQAPWWIKMKGVTWEHPEGPQSSVQGTV